MVGYNVVDVHGATVAQSETITITGTNDAPVVTAALTALASYGDASFSRNLLGGASDPDDGETATLAVASVTYRVDGGSASASAPAGVSLSGTTLSVDPSNPAFSHLAAGASQTITVGYNVIDVHGAVVAQTETITITGADAAPTPVADSVAVNEDATASTASRGAGVLGNDTDPNTGDAATLVVSAIRGAGPSPTPLSAGSASVAGSYGTLTIHSDGTYSYSPNNAAAEALPQGQAAADVFTYTAQDTSGQTATATLTFNITGSNDAPVVTGALTAAANEGDALFTRNLLGGASDADTGETASLAVANVSYSVDGGSATGTAPAGVSLSGTTLSVDPSNPAFNHLAAGVSQSIVVGYNVIDVHGATVAQSETITITGSNDAPVVTAALTAVGQRGRCFVQPQSARRGERCRRRRDRRRLAVASVSYSVDGGSASGTAPAGVSLAGTTLDASIRAIRHSTIWRRASARASWSATTSSTCMAPRWRRARPSPSPAPTMRRW